MQNVVLGLVLLAGSGVWAMFGATLRPTMAADGGQMSQRLQDLESKVDRLDREAEETAGFAFFVLFLFGVVLAMWAQRRGKSGCLWFILGFIPCINIVAAIVALSTPADADGQRG